MMSVPLKINEREFDLLVVLEEDNVNRIREHDPAEIVKTHLGMPWTGMRMRNVMIAYAAPDEAKEFPKRMQNDPQAALRWLTRGFRYRPDQGDHDQDYTEKIKTFERRKMSGNP